MKKLLSAGLSLVALASMAAPSDISSQMITGEAISAISANGEWIVSETGDGSLTIRNLATGQRWAYNWDGSDYGTKYEVATTNAVSNDGIVLAEVSNIPSYWKDGVWTNLGGYKADDYGTIYANIGAITPDGSMIVGGLGRGASFEDDDLMIYPCYWERLDDGSYSSAIWLPTSNDFMSLPPQYLNCTTVADDGNTIGASMTSYSGIFQIPFVFTRDSKGDWTITQLGIDLINTTGRPIPEYPGEYDGPDAPSPEAYMTPEEQYEYYYSQKAQEWLEAQYAAGVDDMMIMFLELGFAREFMSSEEQEAYDEVYLPFAEEYGPWLEAWLNYEQFLINFDNDGGANFLRNNVFLSPDGKYLYTTATRDGGNSYFPVGFEVGTGQSIVFDESHNIIVTCVADGYNVMAQEFNRDSDWYRDAYIFPGNSFAPVQFAEYWEETGNQDAYDWMEEQMYQEVIVSVNASGQEQVGDRWAIGKPISTPDMRIIGFSGSTLYWTNPPTGTASYITFILNTGLSGESGVEEIETVEDRIPTYFNLQGVRVAHPDKGIYIKIIDGKATKIIR